MLPNPCDYPVPLGGLVDDELFDDREEFDLWYCPSCDSYFSPAEVRNDERCPICGAELT